MGRLDAPRVSGSRALGRDGSRPSAWLATGEPAEDIDATRDATPEERATSRRELGERVCRDELTLTGSAVGLERGLDLRDFA
jgi:hypothetical protein